MGDKIIKITKKEDIFPCAQLINGGPQLRFVKCQAYDLGRVRVPFLLAHCHREAHIFPASPWCFPCPIFIIHYRKGNLHEESLKSTKPLFFLTKSRVMLPTRSCSPYPQAYFILLKAVSGLHGGPGVKNPRQCRRRGS